MALIARVAWNGPIWRDGTLTLGQARRLETGGKWVSCGGLVDIGWFCSRTPVDTTVRIPLV